MAIHMASVVLWVGARSLAISQDAASPVQRAEFGAEHASDAAHAVADWIMSSQDNQGLPFLVVDKVGAKVFMFDRHANLLGAASALMGLTLGDAGVPGIGDRPLSLILPSERTTPSGRYIANLALNIAGQAILWVDYDQGISLHPVRSVDPSERRFERLASATAADNRISYGCINVPFAFWAEVVQPVFQNSTGIVYVLPDTQTLRAVFKMPEPGDLSPQK
jgi:hypothetical protein